MTEFSKKLSALCTAEMSAARGDPDRMADMLERLCHTLGMTVAIAAGGNGEAIDQMISGVEGYVHTAAVDYSTIARAMSGRDARQ